MFQAPSPRRYADMKRQKKKSTVDVGQDEGEASGPVLTSLETGVGDGFFGEDGTGPSPGRGGREGAPPPIRSFGTQPCACNNSWCGIDLTGEPCHKVPSGKDADIGKRWLRRVGPTKSVPEHVVTRLHNPKCTLRLHRSHFYEVDLKTYPSSTRVNIRSGFNFDPRFRSRQDIEDGVLAPRTTTHPMQALPSQSMRPSTSAYTAGASSPARSPRSPRTSSTPSTPRSSSSSSSFPTSPTSPSSPISPPFKVRRVAVTLSARKKLAADYERATNPAQFEICRLSEELLAAEAKMLLMSKNTEGLEARIAELEIAADGKTLSWNTLIRAPFVGSIKAFTGFRAPELMESFYDWINHDGAFERLELYRDPDHSIGVSEGERERRAAETRGRSRALAPRDAFVMTLFLLRTGETFTVTGPLFGVDRVTASRHFVTCLLALEIFFAKEWPYPTVEQLDRVTPASVREAMNMRLAGTHFEAFIDCHEQPCEDPTSKLSHKKLFSQYKGCPTFKFFGAVAGNGAFTFASTAFRGRLNDPVVTRLCGYLDVIHPGGVTGADKGFDMISDFTAKKAILVIPPKAFNGQKLYTADEMFDTSKIARKRIHVERAFKRAQEYRILHNKIPVTMFDIWGSIFKVCCYLTNLEDPLIQDD